MAESEERESLSEILNESEVNEDDEEEVTAAEVLERLEKVLSHLSNERGFKNHCFLFKFISILKILPSFVCYN